MATAHAPEHSVDDGIQVLAVVKVANQLLKEETKLFGANSIPGHVSVGDFNKL
jgi:hypothetical protein